MCFLQQSPIKKKNKIIKIFILHLQRKVAENMLPKKKGTKAKENLHFQGLTCRGPRQNWNSFLWQSMGYSSWDAFLHLITSPSKYRFLIFKLRCVLDHLLITNLLITDLLITNLLITNKLLSFYNLKIHLAGHQGVL